MPLAQLPLGVNALQMLVHGRHRDLEQLRNKRLREPDRLILKPALNARAAILGAVLASQLVQRVGKSGFRECQFFAQMKGRGLVAQPGKQQLH